MAEIPEAFAALADVDKVVHEPARLQVLAYLMVLDKADFVFLLNQTGLTRGNLSSHLRRLEEAGYIEVEKTFVERLPMTVYELTPAGRKAVETYRDAMAPLLESLAQV